MQMQLTISHIKRAMELAKDRLVKMKKDWNPNSNEDILNPLSYCFRDYFESIPGYENSTTFLDCIMSGTARVIPVTTSGFTNPLSQQNMKTHSEIIEYLLRFLEQCHKNLTSKNRDNLYKDYSTQLKVLNQFIKDAEVAIKNARIPKSD